MPTRKMQCWDAGISLTSLPTAGGPADQWVASTPLSDVPRESTAAETEQSQRTFNMIYQSN